MEAYMNRKDISDKLAGLKTLDVLLIAGSKSPYIQGVVAIQGKMDKVTKSFINTRCWNMCLLCDVVYFHVCVWLT